MGRLDQPAFETIIQTGCCGPLAISSYVDRAYVVMLADPNDAGRWAYDGEKLIDGTYRIACTRCERVLFESEVCPRCNADGGLAKALGATSRLAVPKRCPKCNELELLAVAFVPARALGTAKPAALADWGDPGVHVVAFACPACDHAVVTPRCPLCDAPGPLRPRP